VHNLIAFFLKKKQPAIVYVVFVYNDSGHKYMCPCLHKLQLCDYHGALQLTIIEFSMMPP
jgi:hypothetical protein